MEVIQLNDPIYQTILVYIVLPLVGIGLIVFALVSGKRLSERPVEIVLDKLGLGLKADAFGLMILVGFVMTSVGVFFLYQGYQTELEKYQTELEKKNNVAGFIATVREKVKEYNLNLILDFPESLNPNLTEADLYIRRKGMSNDVLYKHLEKLKQEPGGIVVQFSGLSEGDTVYVEAEYAGKKWQSDYIRVPTAYLKMKPI